MFGKRGAEQLYEIGNIVEVHANGTLSVLIPGRSHPYKELPSLIDPRIHRVGLKVVVGKAYGNPYMPFVLGDLRSFKKKGPDDFVPTPPIDDGIAGWLQWGDNSQNTYFEEVDITWANLEPFQAGYGTNADSLRIVGSEAYMLHREASNKWAVSVFYYLDPEPEGTPSQEVIFRFNSSWNSVRTTATHTNVTYQFDIAETGEFAYIGWGRLKLSPASTWQMTRPANGNTNLPCL